jgi:hypothetical protein
VKSPWSAEGASTDINLYAAVEAAELGIFSAARTRALAMTGQSKVIEMWRSLESSAKLSDCSQSGSRRGKIQKLLDREKRCVSATKPWIGEANGAQLDH